MALTSGTRLGVHEITAQIGAGGMGEVYRATDTKLKRQVAIKVLPPSLAADRDRLARFQREAEVLASLNHPNIAAIYGLEESEGTTALERNNDITRDGKYFLGVVQAGTTTASGGAAAPQIQVVLNWFEELKARAPTSSRTSGRGHAQRRHLDGGVELVNV